MNNNILFMTETKILLNVLTRTFNSNYTDTSGIHAISITSCTSVWSCIFPLYINQMKKVTRDIKLIHRDTIFSPGDV